MRTRTAMPIEVYRGPLVECVHDVIAVVVDSRGQSVHYAGNFDYVVYPRSSVKMMQALPFLMSGAVEKFGLDDRMIAMAAASHRGEPQHIAVLTEWLKKLGLDESVLRCGPAWPAHEATLHEAIRKGFKPSPLFNNCSGKHLGMISGCMAFGDPVADYIKYEHPYQARIRRVLSELMEKPHDKLPSGVDGCGMPTYAVPLTALAVGVEKFLRMADSPKRSHFQMIIEAWRRHPTLVSGTGDFAAIVNEKTNGRVLIKSGAEGVYTGMMFARGFSFALKVKDGAHRAAPPAILHILRDCEAITVEELKDLQSYVSPEIRNSLDEKVGEIRVQKGQ